MITNVCPSANTPHMASCTSSAIYEIGVQLHTIGNSQRYSYPYVWHANRQERLCGELVRAIKSHVRGAANLSSLIEQQQSLAFTEQFGWVTESSSEDKGYRAQGYQKIYAFLQLKREYYPLSAIQITHLRHKHYMTDYDIPTITNPELRQMDTQVQLWYECHVDNTIFQCPAAKIPPASIILLALHNWRIAMHVSVMPCGTETSRKWIGMFMCNFSACMNSECVIICSWTVLIDGRQLLRGWWKIRVTDAMNFKTFAFFGTYAQK